MDGFEARSDFLKVLNAGRDTTEVRLRTRIEEVLRNCVTHFSGTVGILTLFGDDEDHYAVTKYDVSPPVDWKQVSTIINDAQRARQQTFFAPENPPVDESIRAALKLLDKESLALIVSSPMMTDNQLIGVLSIFGESNTENLVIPSPTVIFESYISVASEMISRLSDVKHRGEREPEPSELIEDLPIGILITDRKGKIIHLNETLSDMIDILPETETGRDISKSQIFGPKRAYHYAKLLNERTRFEFTNRYATPLGGERYIKVRGFPHPKGNEEMEGMLVLATDVTEDINTRKKLSQQEKKHVGEIKLAKDLQQDFFPVSFQKKRIKIATKLVSAKELAGDFFDVFDLGPNSLGVAVGDVVGKGIPASLMAMSVLGMISNAQGQMTSPKDVMDRVNAELVNRIKGDYWYATSFFAKIHVENLHMTFARAGHELPIWWRESTGGCTFLEGNGLPLGMFHNAEYETCQITMGDGDKLVLYTDGLSDALNDEGERFGNQRLMELIAKYSSLSAKNLLKVIELQVRKFMGEMPQMDDIALIILSVVPDSWNSLSIPPYTFKEVLENITRELNLKNVSDDVIFKVRLSLDECITNAFKHGHRSNYREKVNVSYLIDAEKIEIQIQDRGEGFDYASLPDPTIDDYLELPCGRGVYLTMQVMDIVEFNDIGNQVSLTKFFRKK